MAYSFNLIFSILKPIEFLSEISQFRVLKQSVRFLQGEGLEDLQDIEDVAFKMLLPMLEAERQKEERRLLANRQNGRKGGRGKTQKTQSVFSVSLGLEQEDPLSPLSSSPTPPTTISTNPQEYNINISSNAHAREDRVLWDLEKEKSYKEKFLAEGGGMKASRVSGKSAKDIYGALESFFAKCELGGVGHRDSFHFNNHFLQYLKNPENANYRATDKRTSAGVCDVSDILEPF